MNNNAVLFWQIQTFPRKQETNQRVKPALIPSVWQRFCAQPHRWSSRSQKESRFWCLKLTAAVSCVWIKVMVVLLEEEQAEKKSLRKMRSEAHTLSFSDGSLQLNTKLPFLYGTMPLRSILHTTDWFYYHYEPRLIGTHQSQVAASAWCTSPRSRDTPWCRSTAPQRDPVQCVLTAAPSSASGTYGSHRDHKKSSHMSLR